jgi:MSHA biogenesis protein MshN
MSVINQMLRDLDERQATKQERDALPAKLRNLPPLGAAKSNAWWLLIGGMAAGVAIAWVTLTAVSRLSVPAAVPVTAPSPASAAVPAVVVKNESTKVLSPAELGEMKISTLLGRAKASESMDHPTAQPAAPVPPMAAESAPVKAIARTPAEPRHEASPGSAARTTPAVAAPEPSASIDKKAKGGQTRELAEAEYRKGMQALKYGDNAGAILSLRRTLELDPELVKARQALLSLLVSGKQWTEAQQVVQSGLALDPAKSGWALILARLQFELGDTPAALDTLGHYAAHAGADADYQGFFAYLLQKQQRPAEAAERFQAALALRPSEGRWWFGLGLALEGAGKRSEAKEAYAKAREVGNLPPDMAQVIEQRLR